MHMAQQASGTRNPKKWNQAVIDKVYFEWFKFDENGTLKYSVWNTSTPVPDQFPMDEIIRCKFPDFGLDIELFAALHRRMVQTNEHGHCIK